MKVRIFIISLCALFAVGCGGTKSTSKSQGSDSALANERESAAFQQAFFEAQQLKSTGDIDGAYAMFEEALTYSPENDAVHYELARIEFDRNNKDAAMTNIARAIELNDENFWYRRLHADFLLEFGQYDDARKELKWMIDNKPEDLSSYYDLAASYLYEEDGKNAIAAYDLLEGQTGKNPELSFQKQRIFLLMGEPEKAIAELDALMSVYAGPEVYAEQARILLEQGRIDEAKETLKELTAKDPTNGLAHLELSRIYAAEGNDGDSWEAIQVAFADPEVNIDEKVSILLMYLNLRLMDSKAASRGDRLIEILQEAHPEDPRSYSIAGDFNMQDNDLKGAQENFTRAIELDKARPLIWYQLLEIDAALGDWMTMLERANEAVELYPTQANFYLMQGIARTRTDRYTDAITSFLTGKAFVVEDVPLAASFQSNLGEAYYNTKEFKKSDEAFEKSLSLIPDDPFVMNNYAYYLSVRGVKLERAAELSKKSNDLLPNTPSFQDTYGWILFKQGKYNEALDWINQAASAVLDATLFEHLGDVLWHLGRKADAVEAWQEALKIGEGSSQLQKKVDNQQYYEETDQ
ncbi:MAG: tetratricopeptide repeat protein [Flavobacteriales bacterium]|nr:tetratricopeptide repeat protein [Flavobacteriales bacterium]